MPPLLKEELAKQLNGLRSLILYGGGYKTAREREETADLLSQVVTFLEASRPDAGEGLVADLLGLATALDFEDRPINAEICREAALALGREEKK